ncbi:MAG: cyclic nucleotide-binding domain-containing protein [Sulfuritalea sp.]|nr:cyclic nucleotide-binding domain-containing protein [Sulfuritalea sp.]
MDDLDFSGNSGAPAPTPAANTAPKGEPASQPTSLYDPKLALEFFRIAGTQEQFPAGKQIFVEDEKSGGFFSKGARIYLLLEGDVAITLKGKPLELVLPGETFGEMAAIADIPRSATATARKNCRVLALDEKQFLQSLQQKPEFALMLMSIMAQRLRRSIAKLADAKKASIKALVHENTLDKKMLVELQRELGNPSPTVARAGANVVTQGSVGACMFVVTKGRIAISVDGLVIEHVGPGGAFGEMALVDRSGRSATATTETESAWFLIARQEFLSMIKSRPAFGIALLRSMGARAQHLGNLLRSGPQ